MIEAPPLLALRGIGKSFPGVRALDSVSLALREGEIHALVGENGAGKSTLIRILTGAHAPDEGVLEWEGIPVRIPSPAAARRLGVAVIYQEFNLVPSLTVRENLFLGRERPRLGWLSPAPEREASREALARLGAGLDPEALVSSLSIAEQQMVEIARALTERSRLLIMDEPTAALTPREAGALFLILRDLRRQGASIVFVSHRLNEVEELADRVTVLRDGRSLGTWAARELPLPRMIALMVGRSRAAAAPGSNAGSAASPGPDSGPAPEYAPASAPADAPASAPADAPASAPADAPASAPADAPASAPANAPASAHRNVILQVRGLRGGRVRGVSFSLRRGEILGLAGLCGAGRTDLARLLFGADPAEGGEILLEGRAVRLRSPRDAIAHGICLLTEDRKREGLILGLSCRENFALPNLGFFSRRGWIDREAEAAAFRRFAEALRIRLSAGEQPAGQLSGGNQQKLLVARWLMSDSRVILFDEPTRGIDVGAKAEMFQLIRELAARGKAVLMISSELPEVLALSDRILVMHEGRISGEVAGGAGEEEVAGLMVR